jgi:HAD superfamily hydrolase (TIGR01509 family)
VHLRVETVGLVRPIQGQAGDTTVDNFRFSPDYHLDLVLWRRILGQVSDAVYVKPTVRLGPFGTVNHHFTLDVSLIAAAHELFGRDWFGRLVLFDDAVQTLEALRPRFKLGLVTNGPSRTQRPKIEQFQLIDYFDLLIVSEEVGVAKPDPAIFAIALERLGVAPSEALFVGDSPEFDLRGAAAAGMPFIWMNPRGELLPADVAQPLAAIERLSELLPLLDGQSAD